MRLKPAMVTLLLGVTIAIIPSAAPAQDTEAALQRLRDLSVKMTTGTGPPRSDNKGRTPTAYEQLEWYGLLNVAAKIEGKEQEAEKLIDDNEKQRKTLDALFQKLNAAAGSKDVAKGEAGIGKQGLGWYCSRAEEMITQLTDTAIRVQQQSTNFAHNIGEVPLGEGSESTRRLSEFANNFEQNLKQILNHPPTEAMIKDLNVVAEGLAPTKAFEGAESAGGGAAASAAALRKGASRLQDVGVELAPLLRTYTDTRRELGQEIAALKPLIENPKRVAQLADLEKKLLNSRKSSRTTDDWQKLIRKEVDEKFGVADARLEAISKLQAPVSDELQACKDKKDLQMRFARARLDAHETITKGQALVEAAYEARAALIVQENKLLDQAIKKFERTETEAAEKAKIVWGQLQVIDRKTPEWREKEQQYDRLEKQRINARNSIEAIREQRNEYVKEQQSMRQHLSREAADMAKLQKKGPGGGN